MSAPIGFYGIISDPLVGWATLAEIMVEAGVGWIQLRMKQGSVAERMRIAMAVRDRVPRGPRLIVNDDPALARAVQADGVHLGQTDMALEEARSVLGPRALIGLSTHSLPQLEQAHALGPSYVGMGPVFPTGTKLDAEPCIGLEGLTSMVRASSLPSVAIGGIGLERVASVMATGVGGLCAVGPINRAPDPAGVLASFLRKMEASTGKLP
jgi:thiamine-phosphate pyrophosphorylase